MTEPVRVVIHMPADMLTLASIVNTLRTLPGCKDIPAHAIDGTMTLMIAPQTTLGNAPWHSA